jgi:hypothetical protein
MRLRRAAVLASAQRFPQNPIHVKADMPDGSIGSTHRPAAQGVMPKEL